MKKNITLLLCFLILNNLFSQDKLSVGIIPFTYDNANRSDANSITTMVTNAFVKTKRFNILDRSKLEIVKNERELQKSEDFIDGAVIKQGATLGASYLISGHILSASTEQMSAKDSRGGTIITYKAKLNIILKVIDVTTAQVIASETIEPSSGGSLWGALGVGSSSSEDAMSRAMDQIKDDVDDFVNKNFPMTFSLVEIQEKNNKGDADKVLISGGSAFGLKKGDKMKVVEIIEMQVNGKKIQRKKEIGEVKITKVEDENFSICNVNSGGMDISNKFEAKSILQVVSKQ
jgi:curli biogenesis system outer membrane secretion channel CsgG